MSAYKELVIETYENIGEPAAERIRARPLPGQGFPTNMKVECSLKMRNKYPIGSKIKITAKVSNRQGGTPFLYSHYSWDYEILTDEQAKIFIAKHYPGTF